MAAPGAVDAGYYYGDGTFWVDGGAYPDASAPLDASGLADDASTGCGALAACCPTVSGSTQSLCNSVVAARDDTNCDAELAQLQAGGACTGVSILAMYVQTPPAQLVSDGTTLFWTVGSGQPGLYAMPVGGGAITQLLTAMSGNAIGSQLLAVDDVNVYFLTGWSLIRIPKSGAPATLVNQSGDSVFAATVLGGIGYWARAIPQSNVPLSIESGSLVDGGIAPVPLMLGPYHDQIAVTKDAVFMGGDDGNPPQMSLMNGAAPTTVGSGACSWLSSDTNAVYCAEPNGNNQSIASDGTVTSLGPAVSSSYIVSDDTYVYWANMATAGTIVKAPKAGGGPVTILARDTSPTAIAVDATSVYWADQGGYIKSVPK